MLIKTTQRKLLVHPVMVVGNNMNNIKYKYRFWAFRYNYPGNNDNFSLEVEALNYQDALKQAKEILPSYVEIRLTKIEPIK